MITRQVLGTGGEAGRQSKKGEKKEREQVEDADVGVGMRGIHF